MTKNIQESCMGSGKHSLSQMVLRIILEEGQPSPKGTIAAQLVEKVKIKHRDPTVAPLNKRSLCQ
jgi:hypothetical protein